METLKTSILLATFLVVGITTTVHAGGPINIQKEIIINANIDRAWLVLGPQFGEAYKWASSITHSEARDQISFNGSTCSERGCDITGMGSIKEKLTQYSESDHKLAYEVYEGMPKMMKSTKNTWSLTDLGNDKTKLTMNMEAQPSGFMGWMMRPMMKMKLKKLAGNIMEEFKHYTENGKPHPRTLKATKKSN